MPPMCLFRGVRNVAAVHLATLPQDGKSGAWSLHSTEKGFITSEKFVVLLQELVKHLEERQIERPVILFMDGASPHISHAMAEYCKAHGIQPWLFKPNTTHLTQPLDLTVMKSLKDKLKRKVTEWQQRNPTSLTKYTVVPLLREAVEEVLTKPSIIINGFRRAGLVPWDPSAVDTRKTLPSTVFASSKPSSSENPSISSGTASINTETTFTSDVTPPSCIKIPPQATASSPSDVVNGQNLEVHQEVLKCLKMCYLTTKNLIEPKKIKLRLSGTFIIFC